MLVCTEHNSQNPSIRLQIQQMAYKSPEHSEVHQDCSARVICWPCSNGFVAACDLSWWRCPRARDGRLYWAQTAVPVHCFGFTLIKQVSTRSSVRDKRPALGVLGMLLTPLLTDPGQARQYRIWTSETNGKRGQRDAGSRRSRRKGFLS